VPAKKRSAAGGTAARASKAQARRGPPVMRFRSLKDPGTLEEFVRNLQEGVYITATDGLILDANPAFLRMFGVSSLRELRRYTAEHLLVDPQRRREELALLAATGSVREFELELRRPDGEIRTVLDTAYQVTHAESGETLYHGILIDISDRKQLERQLFQAALRDPLTGCFNRRYLMDRESELEREKAAWGVVVVDIDHFKAYNDRYGHHTGDLVLLRVSRFLGTVVRSDDAVVRIGGDEFLLLLTGGGAPTAEEVAHRLRDRARKTLPVSLSEGWAVRQGGETLEETIRRADQQLIQKRDEERRPNPRRRRSERLPSL
jgi:diguanylate cyclase (GGDEF)-like protein/PAS domain S-box-containing protein